MSEVVTQQLEQLHRAMENVAQPLFEEYKKLDADIERKEAELAELKKARTEVRTVVRTIKPDLIEPLYKKNGKRKPGPRPRSDTGTRVGQDTLEALTAWLQERRIELNANGGFRNIDLRQRDDFELGISSSVLSKALTMLHEQGILNLDRWVRGANHPTRPSGKWFKVV